MDAAAENGAKFLYIAMSHRGRINVMKNIVNIPTENIFASMEDVDPRSVLGSGDVKYHTGATGSYTTHGGETGSKSIWRRTPATWKRSNAVLMGRTRGRQDRWG